MRRGLLAAVLICAFIILAAYYFVNVPHNVYVPRESEVSTNYDGYVGRNVTISGEVVSIGPGSFELRGMHDTYTIFSTAEVHPGDGVTVLGTLEPGHQLYALQMYASSRLLSALVYVRSFIALVFVAALFLASWRFDRRGWVIRPKKPDSGEQGGA